ncbi:UNVERIFIED_CONTAM: hypothetical protein Sradi_2386000 [Sesamum radiatum]|uniref:Uncharacterized protein n=1 Tax=Sesamum radiatum TaxID=300843 RepID=A0AAW2T740_SESRA
MADFLDQGFERRKFKVKKLKGFVEEFDVAWLDATLDGNLATFPDEDPPNLENDEFTSLADEVENMNTS